MEADAGTIGGTSAFGNHPVLHPGWCVGEEGTEPMPSNTGFNRSTAAIVASLVCGAAALAQPSESTGGVRAPLAPRMSLGGVKSQAPGPTGVGRGGTLLNRTGTLLPPSPPRSPSPSPSPYRPGHSAGPRPTYAIPTARPDLDGRPIHIGPGYVANPGNISSSTGVVIDANARGDHWNLKFHLGSGYTYSPWWKPWQCPTYRWNDCYYPGSYCNWWYPYSSYSSYSYYTPIVYGQPDPYVLTGVNPAAVYAAAYNAQMQTAQQPPQREPTELEKADAMLMYGESKAAAQAYRKYLEAVPDDAAAMRSLAIALLGQRRFDEAVAVMAMAYDKQPRLARTPIDAALFGDAASLRRQLNSAVTYANRVNSGSAWLLVAALMQAEGREDVAARIAARAREAGLSEPIATELADVLGAD